ncbi:MULTISPECIES: phosphoenolpyruvate--protein phosphotransferase [unclassified Anaerobiospirillum]|uniref:phosphoenolpyruvate--protein phosphotransferase n=1 Tax=unclassified Anaerobiospirillum TaxID=2647410 RepID=UPI001FF561A5|nr:MULTISPECIES: phosphoenolpyruvate--protein phosphotransferase [unclassified Anaerobiospirillum]MCK0535299.1 phosphoenolpyruvate--protein phosphotransferase [Anaerobiospirillum sp. NML120511]MCK0540506.1 phosphoenolpyruvate--protein phosphotransferase [Anaerobiospirillum sp. NML02-A-032]
MDGRIFLQALRQITQEVSSEHDLKKAMNLLVQHIRQTTEADCCSLYLLDEFRKRYRLMATDGLSQQAVGKATLRQDEGLVGVVGTTSEILNLADASAHPNFKYLPDVGEDEYLSFLGVPVLNQGNRLGVLVVQSKTRQIFGEQEESFMVTLAAQIGSIIARSKQENSVEDDVLQRLKGMSSTGEVAIAPALVWQPDVSLDEVKIQQCDDPMMQVELFNQVMFQLQIEMDRAALKMQEGDKRSAASGYVSSYGRLLDDSAFQDEVVSSIEEGQYMATSAVKFVIERRLKDAQISGQEDKFVEIQDFGQVLISRLVHACNREFDIAEPVILVMENISASMVAELPKDKIAGFVATSRVASAHASILARDFGIPSVLGVNININDIDGHTIIVDGRNCEVILDPPESVVDEFRQLVTQSREQHDLFDREMNNTVNCLDGRHITIGLNAGLNQKNSDVSQCSDNIGLFRTEIAFMLCQTFPSEQQQYEWYSRMLEEFSPKPVCMRTLDIGSDKGLSYLPNKENNPALGWRGVRVTMDMPNIMYTQLRAMLRAHQKYGNLELMIPMVSRIEEVLFVKKAMIEVANEIRSRTGEEVTLPRFGVMIEVPSCVYLMDELAAEVDFFSIGSNDLMQYLLAVDRSNPKVQRFYNIFHPAVVRCLKDLANKASQHGRHITLCGESAGEPLSALLLLSLGFTSLSMNYSYISRIKYILRRVSYEQLQELGKKALTMTSAAEIRSLYEVYAISQGLGKIISLYQQEHNKPDPNIIPAKP